MNERKKEEKRKKERKKERYTDRQTDLTTKGKKENLPKSEKWSGCGQR